MGCGDRDGAPVCGAAGATGCPGAGTARFLPGSRPGGEAPRGGLRCSAVYRPGRIVGSIPGGMLPSCSGDITPQSYSSEGSSPRGFDHPIDTPPHSFTSLSSLGEVILVKSS